MKYGLTLIVAILQEKQERESVAATTETKHYNTEKCRLIITYVYAKIFLSGEYAGAKVLLVEQRHTLIQIYDRKEMTYEKKSPRTKGKKQQTSGKPFKKEYFGVDFDLAFGIFICNACMEADHNRYGIFFLQAAGIYAC